MVRFITLAGLLYLPLTAYKSTTKSATPRPVKLWFTYFMLSAMIKHKCKGREEVLMKEFLYMIVGWIAEIHSYLMRLNDTYEYHFSDKELHFIVIGLLGMAFIFIVYPVFKWLAKHNHVMVIAWIYVFTLILVITFAIEIGQKVTNTGAMEFADIVFGVVGFIVMFFIFSIIREIYHLICKLIKYLQDKNSGM